MHLSRIISALAASLAVSVHGQRTLPIDPPCNLAAPTETETVVLRNAVPLTRCLIKFPEPTRTCSTGEPTGRPYQDVGPYPYTTILPTVDAAVSCTATVKAYGRVPCGFFRPTCLPSATLQDVGGLSVASTTAPAAESTAPAAAEATTLTTETVMRGVILKPDEETPLPKVYTTSSVSFI